MSERHDPLLPRPRAFRCVTCAAQPFEDRARSGNDTHVMKRVGSLVDIVCYQRVNACGRRGDGKGNCRPGVSRLNLCLSGNVTPHHLPAEVRWVLLLRHPQSRSFCGASVLSMRIPVFPTYKVMFQDQMCSLKPHVPPRPHPPQEHCRLSTTATAAAIR